jgi:hypothetical protein
LPQNRLLLLDAENAVVRSNAFIARNAVSVVDAGRCEDCLKILSSIFDQE